MLLVYAAVILAVALIFRATFRPVSGPHCRCGGLPAYMFSDGTWECDACREARIGGKAPKGG